MAVHVGTVAKTGQPAFKQSKWKLALQARKQINQFDSMCAKVLSSSQKLQMEEV